MYMCASILRIWLLHGVHVHATTAVCQPCQALQKDSQLSEYTQCGAEHALPRLHNIAQQGVCLATL